MTHTDFHLHGNQNHTNNPRLRRQPNLHHDWEQPRTRYIDIRYHFIRDSWLHSRWYNQTDLLSNKKYDYGHTHQSVSKPQHEHLWNKFSLPSSNLSVQIYLHRLHISNRCSHPWPYEHTDPKRIDTCTIVWWPISTDTTDDTTMVSVWLGCVSSANRVRRGGGFDRPTVQ